MGELTLYTSEDDEEDIVANLDAGYDIMYDNLQGNFESEDELKAQLCRVIEATIYQEIQGENEQPEIHKAFVELLNALERTGEVDIDALAQNSVHQLTQISE